MHIYIYIYIVSTFAYSVMWVTQSFFWEVTSLQTTQDLIHNNLCWDDNLDIIYDNLLEKKNWVSMETRRWRSQEHLTPRSPQYNVEIGCRWILVADDHTSAPPSPHTQCWRETCRRDPSKKNQHWNGDRGYSIFEDHVLRHWLSLCGKLFNIEMGIGGCSKVQDYHFVLGYLGAGLAARPVFFPPGGTHVSVCSCHLSLSQALVPLSLLSVLAFLARWLA